jgi:4-hydroxybenzoate polyprenyltransferase
MFEKCRFHTIRFGKRILPELEKTRLSFKQLFLYVFALGTLRVLLEYYLWSYPFEGKGVPYHLGFLSSMSFLFFAFCGGVAVISFVSGGRVKKVANFVSAGFWIMVLPPVIDYFVFGRQRGYDLVEFGRTLQVAADIFNAPLENRYAGAGLLLCLGVIFVGSVLYVYLKTKSVSKSGLAFFALFVFSALISTVPYDIYRLEIGGEYYKVVSILFTTRILLSLLFLGLFIGARNRRRKGVKIIRSIMRSVISFRTLFFLSLFSFGAFTINMFSKPIPFFMGLLSVLFTWTFTVLLNNIHDVDIDRVSNKDRGWVGGVYCRDAVFIAAILGFLFSLFVNEVVAVFCLLCLLCAVAYSHPRALRLRETLFAPAFIGIGAFLVFLMGYYSQASAWNAEVTLIALLLFVTVSVGTVIKDLKDIEGDKAAGVKTLFTVFGRGMGKKVSIVFLFVSFLAPLILVWNPLFLLFPVLACADFWKNEDYRRTIVIALAYIAIAVMSRV